MPSITPARHLRREDAVEGARILVPHGAGCVEADIVSVKKTEVKRQYNNGARYKADGVEDPDREQVFVGEQVDFSYLSVTGFESSGTFYPEFFDLYERRNYSSSDAAKPLSVNVHNRIFIADPSVDTTVTVADYIGCVSAGLGLEVFLPGVIDVDKAAQTYRDTVETAGFRVIGDVKFRRATEQRVMVYRGFGDEATPLAVCYEFESHVHTLSHGYQFSYLPFDSIEIAPTVPAIPAT